MKLCGEVACKLNTKPCETPGSQREASYICPLRARLTAFGLGAGTTHKIKTAQERAR